MQPRLSAAEVATGKWPFILSSLGIEERFLGGKHGPCPICGGKDRFRFDDKNGRGTWICNQCGAGDGYQLLQNVHGWPFAHAFREVLSVSGFVEQAEIQPEKNDGAKKMAAIKRLWDEALPVESGDPVWKYLHRRTGIDRVHHTIRHYPALPYHEAGAVTYHPALVAIITYPDGKAAGMHRIYLTSDGSKAAVSTPKKLMPSKPLQTASVKLSAVTDTVGIAEGIETALAASVRFGVPVWSCISSGLMESWKPPSGIRRVVVFGDNDPKFAGQAAAYSVAHKLSIDGLDVEIKIPETVGHDWADEVGA